jgi:amino-acid N-acetyltransferase
MAIEIAPATVGEREAITALLAQLRLPTGDLGGERQVFFAAHGGGALVGCVALETFGEAAILRSLAVVPAQQGAGIGQLLHGWAIAEATARGLRTLYLLTTTAAPFFERAGWSPCERSSVPAEVAASAEFRSLCPASAVCMGRSLPVSLPASLR